MNITSLYAPVTVANGACWPTMSWLYEGVRIGDDCVIAVAAAPISGRARTGGARSSPSPRRRSARAADGEVGDRRGSSAAFGGRRVGGQTRQ